VTVEIPVRPTWEVRYTSLLAAVAAASACGGPAEDPKIIAASVHQILAEPARYKGEIVQVHGYLSCVGSMALYATREHAQMLDFMSAISVSDSDDGFISSRCCEAHAKLIGPFTLTGKSERILGPLESVTLLELQEPPALPRTRHCWPGMSLE
jgi:hypothetical protein